eukprot:4530730-Prymnesium_polylepis.1
MESWWHGGMPAWHAYLPHVRVASHVRVERVAEARQPEVERGARGLFGRLEGRPERLCRPHGCSSVGGR